jgi:hypothetical protein
MQLQTLLQQTLLQMSQMFNQLKKLQSLLHQCSSVQSCCQHHYQVCKQTAVGVLMVLALVVAAAAAAVNTVIAAAAMNTLK